MARGSPEAIEDGSTHGADRLIDVEDLGRVRFSGWLADAALEAVGNGRAAPLAVIFDDLAEDAELKRVRDTLASGGGIVGVKARDAFNPEPS